MSRASVQLFFALLPPTPVASAGRFLRC